MEPGPAAPPADRRPEGAFKDADARYRRLIDSTHEGFSYCKLEFDEDGVPSDWVFLEANAAFERLSGFRDVVGKRVLEVAPNYRKLLPTLFDMCCRVAMSGDAEELDITRQGRTIRHLVSSPEPSHFIIVGWDTTQQKRTEEELARSSRSLITLSAVNRFLVRAQSEAELLTGVCDITVRDGGYPFAWVGYRNDDDEMSITPVASSGVDSEFLDSLRLTWAPGPDDAPIGAAIREGRMIVVCDVGAEENYPKWTQSAMSRGVKSSISLPLHGPDDTVFGALCICSQNPDSFDYEEVLLLSEMADDLSFGIETQRTKLRRHQAESDLVRTNERLAGILLQITETLGKVVEARDPYTQGHQMGVAKLSRRLAEEMGLSDEDIDSIEIAALVHDVGKLSVPADILTKPGQLSELEFMLIKEHPRSGYEILKAIDFGGPIAETILQHHERLDGSGYPLGLSGDDVTLAARIVAVADVVEAMASHRPYRPALGIDEAICEIQSHPEKFDPEVIESCLRLYESGQLEV